MNVNKYKEKVIELFKERKATKEQWKEMAECVLAISEGCMPDYDLTKTIDKTILRECLNK